MRRNRDSARTAKPYAVCPSTDEPSCNVANNIKYIVLTSLSMVAITDLVFVGQRRLYNGPRRRVLYQSNLQMREQITRKLRVDALRESLGHSGSDMLATV